MNDAAPATEAELHAYADGRLSPERRAQLDAWLASRPEDAQRIAEWQRSREALRAFYQPVLDEPVPEALLLAARGASPRASGRGRKVALAAAWMAIGAALGALAGWQLHTVSPARAQMADATSVARRAAIAHAVYSPEVRHPVEVGADQEEHLVAWLSKRLGIQLKVPKLAAAGMALVGGRLLPGETGPVAQFMYQSDQGRRMTVYVRTEPSPHRETAFRYARENNVNVFYWVERNSSYAIASGDLGKDELLKVATLVYKQLEP